MFLLQNRLLPSSVTRVAEQLGPCSCSNVGLKDIAIGAEDLGFNSRAGCIGRSVATAAMFLRSCVTQVLNRGDGSRHLLHAAEQYQEYNGDLIWFYHQAATGVGVELVLILHCICI